MKFIAIQVPINSFKILKLCLLVAVFTCFTQVQATTKYDEVRNNITFTYIYGPTMNDYKVFSFDNGSDILNEETYDPKKPTYISFSGYDEPHLAKNTSSYMIVKELIDKDEFNIIVPNYAIFLRNIQCPGCIDYISVSKAYPRAICYHKSIGEVVADFLIKIYKKTPSVLKESLYLSGFSLGAQLVAICAKTIKEKKGIVIPYITALDPAGPNFSTSPYSEHLTSDSAKRVYVIHSDADGFGFKCSCGDLDLWPNKGQRPQPNCDDRTIPCSHYFSVLMYVCILRNSTYTASECTSFDYGHCDKHPKCQFHLNSAQSCNPEQPSNYNWIGNCNSGSITVDRTLDTNKNITGNYYLDATLCDGLTKG